MALFLKVIHIWQKLKSILNWIKANFSAKTYWTFQKIIRKNSWNERSITQRFPGIFKTKWKKLTEKRNKEVNWHVSFNPKIMAEKFGIGPGPQELKIGNSFLKDKGQFHTIKYDFKPASLDPRASGSVELGDSNSLSVKVPHSNGSTETQYR